MAATNAPDAAGVGSAYCVGGAVFAAHQAQVQQFFACSAVPMARRLLVPLWRSIPSGVFVTVSFMSKFASKTTIALISLEMEAMGIILSAFF